MSLPCLLGCYYGAQQYKPADNPNLICSKCHPAEFQRKVAQFRPAAQAWAYALGLQLPEAVTCNICGEETARPRDGFCRRCGAPGDTSESRYVSYQVLEGERLTREDAWNRPAKPRKGKPAPPAKTGPVQVVSAVLLAGPLVERPKRRRFK